MTPRNRHRTWLRHGLLAAFLVIGLGLAAPRAQAALTTIGTFTGSLTETWESRNNYNTPSFHNEPTPTAIMGGGASIANAVMAIYEPGSADFLIGIPPVNAQVSDGVKGLGLNGSGQTATITFATPVSDFGAFWGTGSPSNGFSISFFDVFASIIDAPIAVPYSRNGAFPNGDGGLDWHGWHSTTPIKSLTFTGDYVVVDGLQANPVGNAVPEPATVSLVMSGVAAGLALIARRRARTA